MLSLAPGDGGLLPQNPVVLSPDLRRKPVGAIAAVHDALRHAAQRSSSISPQLRATYHDLLSARLASAQIAVLVLDEVRDTDLSPKLRKELLENAGVRLVALKRNNTRRLYLAEQTPPSVDVEIDLQTAAWPELIAASMECILFGDNRVMRVHGTPLHGGGDFIEVLIDEAPIRAELISYSVRILSLSLLIAVVTSGLVFAHDLLSSSCGRCSA